MTATIDIIIQGRDLTLIAFLALCGFVVWLTDRRP